METTKEEKILIAVFMVMGVFIGLGFLANYLEQSQSQKKLPLLWSVFLKTNPSDEEVFLAANSLGQTVITKDIMVEIKKRNLLKFWENFRAAEIEVAEGDCKSESLQILRKMNKYKGGLKLR